MTKKKFRLGEEYFDEQRNKWAFDKKFIMTIGNFDGLHSGHKLLIDKTIELAKEQNSLALSFHPSPKDFFAGKIQKKIFSLKQKKRAFFELGIDRFESINFDANLASMSHIFFYEKILKEQFLAKGIIVGKNFFFGKNRLGNCEFLKNQCYEDKIFFEEIHLKEGVSSTLLRQKIVQNTLDSEFFELLGRDYFLIEGTIKKTSIKNQYDFYLSDSNQLIPMGVSLEGFFVQAEEPSVFSPNLQKKDVCLLKIFSTPGQKTGMMFFEHTPPFDTNRIYGGFYLMKEIFYGKISKFLTSRSIF